MSSTSSTAHSSGDSGLTSEVETALRRTLPEILHAHTPDLASLLVRLADGTLSEVEMQEHLAGALRAHHAAGGDLDLGLVL